MHLSLTKGSVAHDCQPACELHHMEQGGAGGATGGERGLQWGGRRPQRLGGVRCGRLKTVQHLCAPAVQSAALTTSSPAMRYLQAR